MKARAGPNLRNRQLTPGPRGIEAPARPFSTCHSTTTRGSAAMHRFRRLAGTFLLGLLFMWLLKQRDPEQYRRIGRTVLEDAHERA